MLRHGKRGGSAAWEHARDSRCLFEPARLASAYTLVEVLVSSLILGIIVVALFGAFSSGIATVQAARENLRATQILIQKTEAIRLFTFAQSANPKLASPTFTEFYDPLGAGNNTGGALYQGVVSIDPAPATIPADYRPNMRLLTVTVFWTNHIGTRGVVQQREMQTLIARDGIQNYTF